MTKESVFVQNILWLFLSPYSKTITYTIHKFDKFEKPNLKVIVVGDES